MWKNSDLKEVCGGGKEQKNNNLSYCNGFQKCNKSCTWYGSFDPKKVILDFQDVFRNKIEIQNWILQL